MRNRLLAALCAAMPLPACDVPTVPPATLADVYAYHIDTEPPSILRWPTGSVIRVHLEGGSATRAAVMQAGFERGAAAWNEAARYAEYRLVRASAVAEADVVIRWSDDLQPVDLSGCQPEISRAVTTFCLNADDPSRLHVYPLIGADAGRTSSVRFIVTILGSEAAVPARAERLIAHELGHVLGLGQHSPNTRDLMYTNPLIGPAERLLSARDSATVRVLYHTRADVTP